MEKVVKGVDASNDEGRVSGWEGLSDVAPGPGMVRGDGKVWRGAKEGQDFSRV